MNKIPTNIPREEQPEPLAFELMDEQLSDLANQLMLIDNADILYEQSKRLVGVVVDLKEQMMRYTCAMKQVRTKLEILNAEYNVRHQRNPITSIQTRLKRIASIVDKLERLGVPFSVENIDRNIHDVAGVRVICSYVDDIFAIAEALKSQEDVEVLVEKDYISNPKPNGYRSLHLILSVPVYFTNQMRKMRVEVQIRTIAMDFWATLDHQLKYRQQLPNGDAIAAQLRECADTISGTDMRMLHIRNQIEENTEAPTEMAMMIEKIRNLDKPIE